MLEGVLDRLGDLAQRDHDLAPFCTYRVGGAAAAFVSVSDVEDLERVRDALAGSDVEVLIVGKGSNLLVSDQGFSGLALHLGDGFSTMTIDGDVVEAGASAMLPVVARRTVQAGLAGFEWAVGVPGTVGGAVRMNAGGHGSDISERLLDAEVWDLRSGRTTIWSAKDLGFGYRHSELGLDHIVTAARFQLVATDQLSSEALSPEALPSEALPSEALLSEIVQWRRAKQPGGQNAGSVFANPEGDSAGRLIDAAGLKGFRLRTASVSEKHANFIQAEPNGSADDVFALICHLQSEIYRIHGVRLRPENHLVGFDHLANLKPLLQEESQ